MYNEIRIDIECFNCNAFILTILYKNTYIDKYIHSVFTVYKNDDHFLIRDPKCTECFFSHMDSWCMCVSQTHWFKAPI